jgi:two-component system sensor histidine kinase ChvG
MTAEHLAPAHAAAAAEARPQAMRRRRRPRLFSPLTLRILALNALALILLLVGQLYLGRYEDRLVRQELDALLGQADLFAAAIAEGAVTGGPGDEAHAVAPDQGEAMVRRLTDTSRLRTRLFAPDGDLLADSLRLGGPGGTVQIVEIPPPGERPFMQRLVYDVYDWIVVRVPDWERFPPYVETPEPSAREYPDAVRALAGELSASVWSAPDGGLVMTAAVPVQRLRQVLGAVMVSRTGDDIAESIRDVRLQVLQVFGIAFVITSLLSFWLAQTIARPIRRLARAADRVRPGLGPGAGRETEIPDFRGLDDEIGDLSVALREMTAALWSRMDAIERFAADVAHEIKNPLASLRSAVETAGRIEDPARRAKLMAIIEHDVRRLDRLITDISNASRLDAELARAETQPVDLAALARSLADAHAATAEAPDAPRVVVEPPPDRTSLVVPGFEGRLEQVFGNLLSNALSFSPPGGTVTISLAVRADGWAVAAVSDEGPGIPPGKEEAIFERFYSERPAGEDFGQHSGLGLSISRQIVEALGGTLTAANRVDEDGRVLGAVFTAMLPTA